MGVDYIPDLQRSWKGNDCIMTVVVHFSQPIHCIPCKNIIDTTQFIEQYLEDIIQHDGVPPDMISDRDLGFSSDSWAQVIGIQITKRLISTAFYPQTDSQSEISNKHIMLYLQPFPIRYQDQWDTMLPLVEFTYNNSIHSCTD